MTPDGGALGSPADAEECAAMIAQSASAPACCPADNGRQTNAELLWWDAAVAPARRAESGRVGAAPDLHHGVAAILVGDAEVVQVRERGLEVLGRIQIEAVEAAAREEKQLVALEHAARAVRPRSDSVVAACAPVRIRGLRRAWEIRPRSGSTAPDAAPATRPHRSGRSGRRRRMRRHHPLCARREIPPPAAPGVFPGRPARRRSARHR